MAVTNLTNTTWEVHSGWSATAGYGRFYLGANSSYTVDGREYVLELDSAFRLGYEFYDGESLLTRRDCFVTDQYLENVTNDNSFILKITNGEDVTNPQLISWLDTYGTQILPEEPKITFNITENTEFTLATKGKYCDKDIAVNVDVPVPEVTTEEKTVTPTKSTQTVTPTNADYLSKVTVQPIPNQYIVPSGTKSITSNGTHDVTNYASVSVNVADIPAVVGTKEITENGVYDAIDDGLEGYSSVTVNVPTYITVSSEDELPTDAVDGTIAVVEASGEGYNVTVNFETETPGGTQWGYYLFKNGVYGTDEDVVQEVQASGSSTAQPTPTQISLTNVYSLGLSIGNRYPASESYFGGNYKIDNGSIQTADGFIPITSDCTITFYIPWYD